MAKRTLNDRVLKALKPAKVGKRYDVMDAALPGFGVRVTDKGTKTFTLTKRFPSSDNPTRRALGEYPAMGLAEARQKARKWIDLIGRKIDPQVEVEQQRLAEQRKRANSFAAVAEDFIKSKLPSERKGTEVERDIRREFIPVWGRRPIIEITALDVVNVIKPIARRAPYQAHNCLGHIRRLFGWAVDMHTYGIESSPVDRLRPKSLIGERKARSRVLSDDELRAFWQATGEMGFPYGSIGRMLLLTGQRHHEVSEAPWAEFDLNKGLWTISQARFKSDMPHVVPLTGDALGLLERLPRFQSGHYVFSTTVGKKPTCISNKVKAELDRRMLSVLGKELQPWVIHDLRRTMRSHLSALRVPDHIAEMVIGHGRKGLQRIYDQHRYEAEMREALTLWAGRLRSIVEPAPANVVPLKAAGQ
jgi:integrase